MGAREYDPRTARWLQRDPIDAASGDPNLYRYCGNDPLNHADPSGLYVSYHPAWRRELPGGRSKLEWSDYDLGFGGAVERRKAGKDVLVRGNNTSQARRAAEDVEKQVAKDLGKGKPIHHEAHDDPRLVNPRPHYQTKKHEGHTFYESRGTRRHPTRSGGRGFRGAGRAGGALGILLLGMDLAHALSAPCEEKPEALGGALGSFAGGLAGAWAGAAAGAAIGTAIAPGVGTAIGGVVGGLIGGFAGGYAGGELGEALGGAVKPGCGCP